MEKKMSRRSFMKASAVALGALAATGLVGVGGAEQISGSRASGKAMKEGEMPHVIVKLWPGRSEQQKKQLADAIVKDVVAITGSGEESVSISIEEIKPEDWAEKVYKPDILNKQDKLYKKPGYKM